MPTSALSPPAQYGTAAATSEEAQDAYISRHALPALTLAWLSAVASLHAVKQCNMARWLHCDSGVHTMYQKLWWAGLQAICVCICERHHDVVTILVFSQPFELLSLLHLLISLACRRLTTLHSYIIHSSTIHKNCTNQQQQTCSCTPKAAEASKQIFLPAMGQGAMPANARSFGYT